MKGNLWAIAVLFIGLIVLLPAAGAAYADSARTATANETTAVDYDAPYTLGETDVENYTSFTVTANNATLSEGADYTFDAPNATIDWVNTTATSDGDTAAVNYTYTYYDTPTQTAATILTTAGTWIGFAAVIVVLGYVLVMIPGGSGGW